MAIAIPLAAPTWAQSILYVANSLSDSVSVIDTRTNSILGTIDGVPSPRRIAIAEDGQRVFVTSRVLNGVVVIDATTLSVASTIENVAMSPEGIAIRPGSQLLYVTSPGSNAVVVIDTVTYAMTDELEVGEHPTALAFTPSGHFAYVTNSGSRTVSVINTLPSDPKFRTVENIAIDSGPFAVAVTPEGDFAYVANSADSSISVINTQPGDAAFNQVVDVVGVGSTPSAVAITRSSTGDRVVYVTNFDDGTVSVIDANPDSLDFNSVVATIREIGAFPASVFVGLGGDAAYVTNFLLDSDGFPEDGFVAVIDTASNQVVSPRIPVQIFPLGIAIGPAVFVPTPTDTPQATSTPSETASRTATRANTPTPIPTFAPTHSATQGPSPTQTHPMTPEPTATRAPTRPQPPRDGCDGNLVSRSLHGTSGNGPSSGVALNAGGNVVVYYSDASDLVEGDTNHVRDVFLCTIDPNDPSNSGIERVSVSSSGTQGNKASHLAGGAPAINSDGSAVAFYSDATNLVAGDNNGRRDVFVRFRDSHTTELVSVGPGGEQGNGDSLFPSISADGRYVAFQSQASNLVPDDTNNASDIFIRDLVDGRTEVLCGIFGDRSGSSPAISDDGNWVAFASSATNLVAGDNNRFIDIFVCDRSSGFIERVSVPNSGIGEANGDSNLPAISAAGEVVGFTSRASNLVAGDHNNVVDVFVRDRVAGVTERISVSRTGGNADDASSPPSISDDGLFVGFSSYATNLVPNQTNNTSHVFVRNRSIDVTLLADRNDQGERANAGTLHVRPAMSGDGGRIGFVSRASNLSLNDRNDIADVFVAQSPFFGPGSCPDGACPEGEVCADAFCVVPTPTRTPSRTLPPTATGTVTPTPSPTGTFAPCIGDEDCPGGEKCAGGFCRYIRNCDPGDPALDLLMCFERETCISNECECVGDCNLDGFVVGTEITRSIRVRQGSDDLRRCAAADADLDGAVFDYEVSLAVFNVAEGCLQEGRPLVFRRSDGTGAGGGATIELSTTDGVPGGTVLLTLSVTSVSALASAQIDIIIDRTQLKISGSCSSTGAGCDSGLDCGYGEVCELFSCSIDSRLSGLRLVAASPRFQNLPAGFKRLRVAILPDFPLPTFEHGVLATCELDVSPSAVSGGQNISLDRLEVGDAEGNVVAAQAVLIAGNIGDTHDITPTPTPKQCGSVKCLSHESCEVELPCYRGESCESGVDRCLCPTSNPLCATPTVTATPQTRPCAGDCDSSRTVTVDEITRLVNIALGHLLLSECSLGDLTGDGFVTVDEISAAVSKALMGCG